MRPIKKKNYILITNLISYHIIYLKGGDRPVKKLIKTLITLKNSWTRPYLIQKRI